MSRGRRITAEILDSLDREDPRAVRSRRDLRRLNALMGHAGIFDRQMGLGSGRCRPKKLLELGSGDGWFAFQVLSRMPNWAQGGEVVFVDREPSIPESILGALDSGGWKVRVEASDLFEFLRRPQRGEKFDACFVNLMLHHFRDHEIREIFQRLQQRTRSIAACEPRRSRLSGWAARCVGLVGCGAVTRYDALVSVHAGFKADELSRLWPRNRNWMVHEKAQGLFSHFFNARNLET